MAEPSLDFSDHLPQSVWEAVSAFGKAGIPVFPIWAPENGVCGCRDLHCDQPGKHPNHTFAPFGHNSATTDPAKLKKWFGNCVERNYGIRMGQTSGLVCLDIDLRNGGDDTLRDLERQHGALPPTWRFISGSGGDHILFRCPAEGLASRHLAGGIDLQADGTYIVGPGSLHISGRRYQVSVDHAPGDVPLAELPAWVARLAGHTTEKPHHNGSSGSIYGQQGTAQALDAALAVVPNDDLPWEDWNRIGMAFKAAGGSFDAWDRWSARSAKYQDRATLQRWKHWDRHGADSLGAGTIYDLAMRHGWSPAPGTELHAPPPLVEIAALVTPKQSTYSPSLKLPAGILDVGGVLAEFVAYCNRTAISPQPFLALAAAICATGALAGQRYRTSTDLRTNIYAVGIADSASGKDHARRMVKKCFGLAGLLDYLGGEDIASGAAINAALAKKPMVLFQIDEFGDWLREILDRRASAHKRQIAQRLKTAYSSASSIMIGTEYANQDTRSKDGRPRKDIFEPCVCLYGTATPRQFWEALKDASMEDGLMARFIMFESPDNFPDHQEPSIEDPGDALIGGLRSIAAGILDPAAGNLAQQFAFCVPETSQATQLRLQLGRDQLKAQRKAEGTYVTAIAGRFAENAMKLALIRAVSRNPRQPGIGHDDVEWGRILSRHCVDTLLREAERNLSSNEFEGKMKRLLAIIRRRGPMSCRDMLRSGFKLPERERNDILRSLVEAGEIVAVQHATTEQGGRPTVRYQAVETGDPTPF